MKILIVGGVAGGASAATRLRRLDERAEIILFEKGPYVSYANCGLPYYIGGVIAEKEKLLVTKPELLRRRFCIDVRTENEVTAIDRAAKKVTVRDLRTNRTYEESYDKLLLSPGAAPKRLPVEGNDLEGVFTLRTVPDTLAIDAYIREKRVKQAVVVGAGFIGVEMAENLKKRGPGCDHCGVPRSGGGISGQGNGPLCCMDICGKRGSPCGCAQRWRDWKERTMA